MPVVNWGVYPFFKIMSNKTTKWKKITLNSYVVIVEHLFDMRNSSDQNFLSEYIPKALSVAHFSPRALSALCEHGLGDVTATLFLMAFMRVVTFVKLEFRSLDLTD